MGILASIFGGRNDANGPQNGLAKIETIAVTGPDGPTHGILVSVNAPRAVTFANAMAAIVAAFKNQRMMSPPDTSFLVITIVGEVPAPEFKRLWELETRRDEAVGFFLAQMTKADVLRGTADGKLIDAASLKN